VRATHGFLREEDIRKMKPLVRDESLHLVTLFGIRDATAGFQAFIGVAGNKIEMLFIHPDARGKGMVSNCCVTQWITWGATKWT
jgi:putative acetyltransferase